MKTSRRFFPSSLSIGRARLATLLVPLFAAALVACGDDSATGSAGPGGGAGGQGEGGHGDGGKGQGGKGQGGDQPARTVVVLFTSDEHSHLLGFSPERDDFPVPTAAGSPDILGGAARVAAVIAKERKAAKDAGKDSILVSAGDNQMGTLVHTAFESDSLDYATMKTLGYDATTFGNHEFDFGPGALAKSITAAEAGEGLPPIVASNIHFSSASTDDDALEAHFSADVKDAAAVHPYRVLTTASGLKIGVIGYVGVNASHVAPNKTPVAFSEVSVTDPTMQGDQAVVLPHLYDDLQPVVDKLRTTEKVDLVIALAHGGVDDTSSQAGIEKGDDYNVCKNVSGLDFIVSGHAHNDDPKPIEVDGKGGGKCLVLNASSFGRHLGRVEFTVPGDGSAPTWDKASQTLIPVTAETVPEAAFAARVPVAIEKIESGSYLAAMLSTVTSTTVTNDPATPGDLYFYPLTSTTYDLDQTHALLFLSSDAMLAQADAAGQPADIGLESAGVIRAKLLGGATGSITAADAFDVVPLGSSPVDGSVGYPLVEAYIAGIELRGVVEFGLALGPTNGDYDLGAAGMKVEYDATRPAAVSLADLFDPTKGQVMRISIDTDHTDGFEQFDKVVYDREAAISDGALVRVVTSSYIAQFAADAGVSLKDAAGTKITIEQAIMHRSGGAEYKQIEAFLSFLFAAGASGLPDLYDLSSSGATQRLVCTNGC